MESRIAQSEKGWGILFAAWALALVSTLGSLFFSEVMKFPPCLLCWYQRIFMFPLAVILLLGLFPLDRKVFRYGIALAIGGALVAFYQVLLYYGVLPETAAPCTQGASCTATHINWLGFISIPLLSFLSFSGIIALLLLFRRTYE